MNNIKTLRNLVENQQYAQLKEQAQLQWQQTENPAALVLVAVSYAHLGRLTETQEVFEEACTFQEQMDLDARCDLAVVSILMQHYDQAITWLQQIVEAQPSHALALGRLGYCQMMTDKLKAAQVSFELSLEIAPQRIRIWNNLARLQLQQNQFEQTQKTLHTAQQKLAELLTKLPESVFEQQQKLLLQTQCQLWVATGNFASAEQWLKEQYQLQQTEHLQETQSTQQQAAEFIHWLIQYAQLLAQYDHHEQSADILQAYLKYFPDNIDIMMQLAEIVQVQGYFMQAVNLLRRAIKVNEIDDDKNLLAANYIANIGLWIQLSGVCLRRFDQHARNAAEKALALAENLIEDDHPQPLIKMQRAKAKNAMAQVYSHEQKFDAAQTLFLEVLEQNEHFLPALQGLGSQYMQQGKIDEALELYEKIKQIDPIKGYSVLINARRFPEDEATLNKMEKEANQPSLEGKAKASILFQLANAWEKRQQYNKAFELVKQANHASKKTLPYDAKQHRNECARIRKVFCKALYQHRKECGIDSTVPVYVLGMPRSGTTLVEQIISGHSEIFGAGELGVIPQVAQGLNRWERHIGSGRRYPDCSDDLTPDVIKGIAENVLKELQELPNEGKLKAKHVVDKLPHNFENIGLIKLLFPNAKIISVRRDPRDIAMSNYFTDYQAKYGGMGFAYDMETIGQQLADHNLMMHHWQQTFPGEILELNYEDVVDDLEGSARKMLNYIGVDWQPEVLKFNELDRSVKTASVWQVRQPLYKTSKAKWKRYETHLGSLIKGTNAKIQPDAITDMMTLPVPGLFTNGVALYQKGDLDAAEMSLKKMLHHNPEHGGANYMLGLIYMSKSHPKESIAFIEKALEKAPWHKEWQDNLLKAYQQQGELDKITVFEQRYKKTRLSSNNALDPLLGEVEYAADELVQLTSLDTFGV